MIVLSIQPEKFSHYKKALLYAKNYGADAIEVRGEKLKGNELIKILKSKELPLIFTYRINQFSYSRIKDASKKYRTAIEYEVDYIDVDINLSKTFINKIKKSLNRTKHILSYHNYEKTPKLQQLLNILNYSLKISADYYKIVTYANSAIDNYNIFKLIEYAERKSIPLIAHCMGEYGKSGRLIARKLGSKFFYTSLNSHNQTATGQITLEKAVNIFNVKQLYPSTRIYGIVGNPLKQSKSWLFHNYGFNETSSNAIYLNFQITDLEEFISQFKNYLRGLSVTIPFKEQILVLPNISSKIIREIGSANTAIFKDSKPLLFNTDYLGFRDIIKKEKYLKNSKILIIGAGGSARPIIYALKKFNNEIFIINRTNERSKQLAEEFEINYINRKSKIENDFDVIINTTPGNNIFMINLVKNLLSTKRTKLVIDLDLNIKESKLLVLCRSKKIKTINGFDFFLSQAIHQFKIFTGKNLSIRKAKKFVEEHYDQSF